MCTDPNGEAYMISKAYAESCFPTFSLKPPYGNWIHVEDSFMVSLGQLADTVVETSDHTHAPRNGQDEKHILCILGSFLNSNCGIR